MTVILIAVALYLLAAGLLELPLGSFSSTATAGSDAFTLLPSHPHPTPFPGTTRRR